MHSPTIIAPPQGRPARLGVLINMRSGRNRGGMGSVEKILASRPDIMVRRTHDAAEVRGAMADFAAAEIDVLAISGGDGTMQRVLNIAINDAPFSRMPLLALLPGGTTNMIAYDVGTVRKRGEALAALLRRLDRGAAAEGMVERHLMRLEGGDTRYPRHGLFFGAAGVFEATQDNRKSIDAMGFRDDYGPALRLATIMGKLLMGRDPVAAVPMRLDIDQSAGAEREYIAVFASTMSKLTLGLRPFWGQGEGPIRMTTIAKGAHRLYRAAWPLVWGKPSPLLTVERGYGSHNIASLELSFEGGTVLDGEFFFATKQSPLRLSVGPKVAFITG